MNFLYFLHASRFKGVVVVVGNNDTTHQSISFFFKRFVRRLSVFSVLFCFPWPVSLTKPVSSKSTPVSSKSTLVLSNSIPVSSKSTINGPLNSRQTPSNHARTGSAKP